MMPVSHGYYVVEDQSFRGGSDDFECSSVVVQREPVGDIECWFFGVSDNQIADGIHKYIQSHLFSKNPNEVMNILHNAIPFKDYFHEKKNDNFNQYIWMWKALWLASNLIFTLTANEIMPQVKLHTCCHLSTPLHIE